MKLYELSKELDLLEDKLENNVEGESALEVVAEAYFATEEALEKKIEACGAYLLGQDAEEAAIKHEIDRLKKRQGFIAHKRERFKEYVLQYMVKHNILKLRFPSYTVQVVTSRGAVEITDAEKIPAKFIEIVTTNKIKKNEINKALAAGTEVDGATLVKKETLRVK